jgi:type 1 glutamine amidotransferase
MLRGVESRRLEVSMKRVRNSTAGLIGACAALILAATLLDLSAQQAPAAPGAAGGRAGGRGAGAGVGPAVFTAADTNKDGVVTRAELMAAIEKWYMDADSAKAGSITPDQLAAVLAAAFPAPQAGGGRGAGPACGGNSPTKTPCPEHVAAMMAALPAAAPAKPGKPRKILALGNAQGFVHSSIPLASATVEAMGNKLKTWTTTITYNPADINTENLKQYDAVFLSSTTGCFLDAVPGQPVPSKAEIEARRAALLAFVRSGKGLAGIHAATDSYHGTCPSDQPADGARGGRGGRAGGAGAAAFTPGGQLGAQIVTAADKNTDQKLTLVELDAMANAWYDTMDTDKSGRIAQADFPAKFASLTPAAAGGGRAGGRGAGVGAAQAPPVARGSVKLPAEGSWPEFNKMIGGYFKFHWVNGTHIPVKIDDPKSPLNKVFAGKGYEIVDETYTFAQDSFSRQNVHVLTSVDYDKMPQATKDMEPAGTARTDGDYALSYIRREGQGRVFYEANGHDEKIYAMPNILEHVLAGIQYALGDLKADDSPSVKPAAKK